ncbi:phosphoenolpyruvate carboxykinase, cytosolic [GTP]-like isoform X2 [Hydractinia symbiolongicarpus]|nr:phosphoenolpyruvate carboxykinase, cytosolic [GTP]-like isoform X2 [Hydractinia symbiolongicarpus]XP_057291773.1 phosphoenolpyruvate carboxykinase, cytosolic [GTP]-like isoform X2 [Hydractinia symbiolongicarpus]
MASLPQGVNVTHGSFDKLSEKLKSFVAEKVKLCQPDALHICDGSDAEEKILTDTLVKAGMAHKLEKMDNCFAVRTNPADVARVESKTVICTKDKHESIPHAKEGVQGRLGQWADPDEMEKKLTKLFDGCMKGRTMYLIPFSMGPVGSPLAKIGIELTDSPYVTMCMKIMTRMGAKVLETLGDGDFVKCSHSVGKPLPCEPDPYNWPCNPENTIITHFPAKREIVSFGSGYGGNSLLGKKCFALRIASVIARDEGWLAEHMLILGLTNPEGKKKYIAAAFPSACGKTNMAMITPTIPGWKAECVGDDIAWMKFDKEGNLRAINPEYGFFGVCPGTSMVTNPEALLACQKDTVFTNVATTDDGGYFWEGVEDEVDLTGKKVTDWLGKPWTPGSETKAAHPNSRFCAPAKNCRVMDPLWESPDGVPIEAILFGGRRPHGVPLIFESFNWQHGVFVASSMCSEATFAAEHKGNAVMRDPFAMRPFFGYNAGQYFQHWLDMEKDKTHKLPKIYHVNWFRRDENGGFLWPGFGENSRVLAWIWDRLEGKDVAEKTPIGYIPKKDTINIDGLGNLDMEELMSVPKEYWMEQLDDLKKYYEDQLGEDLPKPVWDEFYSLRERFDKS